MEAFRSKRRDFRNSADQKYSTYLIGLTDELKTDPKRFLVFFEEYRGRERGLPTLVADDVEISNDIDKAGALNKAFAARFTNDDVTVFPDCSPYDLPPLTHFECSIDLVKSILESIPVNKACGPDGISARIVRECSDELSVPIAKICALSLRQGTFPACWKKANIVPLHKKGSVKDPDNYRSVSLIPLFGKVLEKVAYLT